VIAKAAADDEDPFVAERGERAADREVDPGIEPRAVEELLDDVDVAAGVYACYHGGAGCRREVPHVGGAGVHVVDSQMPDRVHWHVLATDRRALAQLWLFWAAAIAGALVAGIVYRLVAGEKAEAVAKSLGASTKRAAWSRRR
jgi:hypothetical protein